MDTGLMHHYPSLLQQSQLRDVWNHASFLVHISYDLDWAIDQFEMLEKEAPNCLIKAILLLNIGITHSLQAEYPKAEEAFRKVLPLHPLMAPLAHFFLGVVRFELTNYEQAQISFKLCAYILKQTDRNRAYHSLGLDFTLSHHLVVENEEIAAYEWTLKQKGRMPAPLVFNSTVLNNEFEICCDRLTGLNTPRSVLSSSVFSLHSESVSTMTESATNNSIPRPVHDLTADLSPVIPWRPFKKPMIPRTAQAETSNLRSLTHFLKYTGPEDSQTTRPEKTTIPSVVMEQTNTPSTENQAGASTKRTGPVRQALLQAADQAELGSLLRKASTFTLKK
ncbi:hypothetical protein E4T49_08077 [Aureobasidium sp. EXF-10728]|nr:hypothetical protein E4T49_08077 [Aureobasidium sp. EXF-10728]